MTPRMRLLLRLLEAIVLSGFAGLFVWVLAMVPFFAYIPVVSPALLGFLCGGAATMRTLGVTIYDRKRRMLLAGVCALVGYSVVQTLEYRKFNHFQLRQQKTMDYRLTDSEARAAVAAELRDLTGRSGAVGYYLAAYQRGHVVFGVRLSRLALVLYWLVEIAVAVFVAARWAGGPAPGVITQPTE